VSYMRAPLYAWSSGPTIHLWPRKDAESCESSPRPEDLIGYPDFDGGIAIATPLFDALVLLRMAQIVRDKKLLRRAVREAAKHRGNAGTYDLLELLGKDPEGEFRKLLAEAKRKRDA